MLSARREQNAETILPFWLVYRDENSRRTRLSDTVRQLCVSKIKLDPLRLRSWRMARKVLHTCPTLLRQVLEGLWWRKADSPLGLREGRVDDEGGDVDGDLCLLQG